MEENLEKPKVSIIIPTYNSEETLAECLKTVQDHSYRLYRVIVGENFGNGDNFETTKESGAKICARKNHCGDMRNEA